MLTIASMLNSINYDSLDFEADNTAVIDSGPFTGIAWEIEPNGNLANVVYYQGLQWGPARTWDPSGVLIEEEWWNRNSRSGSSKSWNDRGQLIREATFHGILVSEKIWNSEGNLLSEFSLGPDDPWIRSMEKYPNQADPDDLQNMLREYEENYQGKITNDLA